ncbi:hypothetical protein [Solitalea lacus]|uniref:hypothetical protein n=1 Tax=Solitalea lacus TaxID=2911172 RepID=UPI001EDBFE86|nr:hypothetical protein [Solitalea lacus]UKJ09123.1 hypothetical protein L2B55_08145 [Solitalea lacus]
MLKRLTEKNKLVYLGLIIGVAYGLVTRFVFGEKATLVSLSYLFLVPAVLGIVPLIFADDRQIKSYKTIIFIPWLTVSSAFLIMFLLGWEETICLLILGGPFFILATIGALIFRLIRINRASRHNTLLTVILIPFLFSPLEEAFKSPSEIYTVKSEVTINSTPNFVWNNIIRVSEIQSKEYNSGLFNRLGVPRPIAAELKEEKLGALRIGHFEGGLTFIETITDWQPNQRVSFDIKVDPTTIGNRVFDKHVLEGGYFHFVNATYEIKKLDNHQLKLSLNSSYRLTSKVNYYNRFWGNLFLQDFQDRLLEVIKHRCDK